MLSETDQARILSYKSRSKQDLLSITPLWVTDEPAARGAVGSVVIDVSPSKLINHCHDLGMPANELFNDNPGDIWFVANMEKWENGTAVNPPNVSLYNPDQVIIDDGKHRAILAYYLGEATLPIEVVEKDAEAIAQLLAPVVEDEDYEA